MFSSGTIGMCFTGIDFCENGSIESLQTIHWRALLQFTTKMADQDVTESHDRTVNLETLLGVEQK